MKIETHNKQKTHFPLLFSLCLCLFVSILFADQAVAIKVKDCDRIEGGRYVCVKEERTGQIIDSTRYKKALCDKHETHYLNSCLEWKEPEKIYKENAGCISLHGFFGCEIETGEIKDGVKVTTILEIDNCFRDKRQSGGRGGGVRSFCLEWFKSITDQERLDALREEIHESIKKSNEKDLSLATNILGLGSKFTRTQPGAGGGNVTFIISLLTKILLAISSTVAVVLVVLYGVRLIYSQHIGNVGAIGDLNKKLINVGFGILMLLLSFLIFQFIDPDILSPTLIFGSKL